MLRGRGVPGELEIPRLGAEGLQCVALAALPDAAVRAATVLRGEAHLLEPRREGGDRVAGGGGGRIRGERGLEALNGGLAGRRRERGDDLADAVARGLGLDLEDVGDGVSELGGGGPVLRCHGQCSQPLRWVHRWLRHGGGDGGVV